MAFGASAGADARPSGIPAIELAAFGIRVNAVEPGFAPGSCILRKPGRFMANAAATWCWAKGSRTRMARATP